MPDKRLWISIVVLLTVFIVTSYFAQKFDDQIAGYIQTSSPFTGSFVYVLIVIISTVVAPITSLPLISIVANIWGSLTAAVLCIIGSAIGGLIAFSLAKKYGKPAIKKLASGKELDKVQKLIPQQPKHAFWTVVFLNLIIPGDILSYALGLFSNIKASTYFMATLLGTTPSIMIFAYSGTLPVQYQIIILSGGVALILFLLKFWIKHLKHG